MDPWSKRDYSRHIREALMVVEKLPEINPPSGRVPGQVRLVISICELQRRRNSGENCETEDRLRVFRSGDKYRLKEGTGGGPTGQAGPWRSLPLARVGVRLGGGGVLLAPLRASRVFFYA